MSNFKDKKSKKNDLEFKLLNGTSYREDSQSNQVENFKEEIDKLVKK